MQSIVRSFPENAKYLRWRDKNLYKGYEIKCSIGYKKLMLDALLSLVLSEKSKRCDKKSKNTKEKSLYTE